MSRKNRNKHILLKNIKIIDTAHKGKSITKHEERVIIVEGGVPGDICDITVFKRKNKYSMREGTPEYDFFQKEYNTVIAETGLGVKMNNLAKSYLWA